jgi:hypothetical protein
MLRRCLKAGCNKLTPKSRCPEHTAEVRAKYHGTWPAHSKAMIAAHVAANGWTCPGWNADPTKVMT